ncbi:hypothetical protein Pfo_016834 [Paulownia fortunei]|nr:hypothetical protein Pfo_016834 [Paulownia fortunei]
MEFFQEPTFTAFLALILSFVVAKIVSFAVSNSKTDDNTVVCSINEGAVAKDLTVDRGLRIRSAKGKKRVKFVDDVMIRRIDRYEGTENLVLLDDVESVGEVIVEGKSVDETSRERVDQFGDDGLNEDSGGKKTNEQCFDVKEMHDADAQDKGSEKVEMLIEKQSDNDNIGGGFSEKEKTLVTSWLKSVIVEEQKNEVELEADDMVTDQKEGYKVVGSGEHEVLVTGDVEEVGKVRDENVDDEDDDWEGIERSELEKAFAEAVNYLEYGGKGKDKENDQLAKLDSDVQMQLYGLHKVAVEGPCHEPQPMALKVSARAKWNAWQRLGSMSQEAAMEQYIRVLSESTPGWMHDYSADDDIQGYPKLETVGKISVPEYERKSELVATPIGDSSNGQSSVEKDDMV